MAYPLPQIEMLTGQDYMEMPADAEMSDELHSLKELSASLGDRTRDSMSRKQSSYRAYNLSRSRRER